jgi:hypothetical protein
MTRRLFVAGLVALVFTSAGRAADEVKEIGLPASFKATGRPMTPANKPTEITSADDLKKTFPVKEVADTIAKDVDFDKQKLLFFAWASSGQDKIIPGDVKDGAVVFGYKRGLTRDLRSHYHLFALPKDLKWSVENAK